MNRTRKMEGSSKLPGKLAIKKNKLYSVFQTTDCLEKNQLTHKKSSFLKDFFFERKSRLYMDSVSFRKGTFFQYENKKK